MLAPLACHLFPGYTSKALNYVPLDPAFVACNPSIHCDSDGRWRCILRCINYRLGVHVPAAPRTENVMVELDQNGNIVSARPMADLCDRARSGFCISGYEDCRLFEWQGGLWATATCCDLTKSGNREMCLLEIGPAPEYSFRSCRPLRGPWSIHYQKNWIPVVDGDQLQFIYSLERNTVIGEQDTHPRDTFGVGASAWSETGKLRGSSAAVALDGGWLVLAHERDYRSRFVLLDRDLRYVVRARTDAFYFRRHDVEFSAGMAMDPVGGQIVVSYSVRDATCELGYFPLSAVVSRLKPC